MYAGGNLCKRIIGIFLPIVFIFTAITPAFSDELAASNLNNVHATNLEDGTQSKSKLSGESSKQKGEDTLSKIENHALTFNDTSAAAPSDLAIPDSANLIPDSAISDGSKQLADSSTNLNNSVTPPAPNPTIDILNNGGETNNAQSNLNSLSQSRNKNLKLTSTSQAQANAGDPSTASPSINDTRTTIKTIETSVAWDRPAPKLIVSNSNPSATYSYSSRTPVTCSVEPITGNISLLTLGVCTIVVATAVEVGNSKPEDAATSFAIVKSNQPTPLSIITYSISQVARAASTLILDSSTDFKSAVVKTYSVNTISPASSNACAIDANGLLSAQVNSLAPIGASVTCEVTITANDQTWYTGSSASAPVRFIFSNLNSIDSVSFSRATPVAGLPITATINSVNGVDQTSVAYQWSIAAKITGNFIDIAAATSSSYTPQAADLGNFLKITVTAGVGVWKITHSQILSNVVSLNTSPTIFNFEKESYPWNDKPTNFATNAAPGAVLTYSTPLSNYCEIDRESGYIFAHLIGPCTITVTTTLPATYSPVAPITKTFSIVKSPSIIPPVINNPNAVAARKDGIAVSIGFYNARRNQESYTLFVTTISPAGSNACKITNNDYILTAEINSKALLGDQVVCSVVVKDSPLDYYETSSLSLPALFTFNAGNAILGLRIVGNTPQAGTKSYAVFDKVTGPDALNISYQWYVTSGPNFLLELGATSSSYTPPFFYIGKTIRVQVSIGSGENKVTEIATAPNVIIDYPGSKINKIDHAFSEGAVAWDENPPTNSINSKPANATLFYASDTPDTCTVNSSSGAIKVLSVGVCQLAISATVPTGSVKPETVTNFFIVKASTKSTPSPIIVTPGRSVGRNDKISIVANSNDSKQKNLQKFTVTTTSPTQSNACQITETGVLSALINEVAFISVPVTCQVRVSENDIKWYSNEGVSDAVSYTFGAGNVIGSISLSKLAPQFGDIIVATINSASGPDVSLISYQWSRALSSNGPFTDIENANALIYRPLLQDIGYFLKLTAKFGTGVNSANASIITSQAIGLALASATTLTLNANDVSWDNPPTLTVQNATIGTTFTFNAITTNICSISPLKAITIMNLGTCTIGVNTNVPSGYIAPDNVSISFNVRKSSAATPAPRIITASSAVTRTANISIVAQSSDVKMNNLKNYLVTTTSPVNSNACLINSISGVLQAQVNSAAPISSPVTCSVQVTENDATWYSAIGASSAVSYTFNPGNSIGQVIFSSDTPTVGRSIGVTLSKLSGPDSQSIAYQWSRALRETATFINIPGATASSYLVRSADLNSYLKLTAFFGSADNLALATVTSKAPAANPISGATYFTFSKAIAGWDQTPPTISVRNTTESATFIYSANPIQNCSIDSITAVLTLKSIGICSVTVSTKLPAAYTPVADVIQSFNIEKSTLATPQPVITTQSATLARNGSVTIVSLSNDKKASNNKNYIANTIFPALSNACVITELGVLSAQVIANAPLSSRVVCEVSVSEDDQTWYSASSVSTPKLFTFNPANTIEQISLSNSAPKFNEKIQATISSISGPDSATVSYQWYRADSPAGVSSLLTNETRSSYIVKLADLNKYLKVVASIGAGATSVSNSVTTTSAVTEIVSASTITSLVNATIAWDEFPRGILATNATPNSEITYLSTTPLNCSFNETSGAVRVFLLGRCDITISTSVQPGYSDVPNILRSFTFAVSSKNTPAPILNNMPETVTRNSKIILNALSTDVLNVGELNYSVTTITPASSGACGISDKYELTAKVTALAPKTSKVVCEVQISLDDISWYSGVGISAPMAFIFTPENYVGEARMSTDLPSVGIPITVSVKSILGPDAEKVSYQWSSASYLYDGVVRYSPDITNFIDIPGATTSTFSPTYSIRGHFLKVTVSIGTGANKVSISYIADYSIGLPTIGQTFFTFTKNEIGWDETPPQPDPRNTSTNAQFTYSSTDTSVCTIGLYTGKITVKTLGICSIVVNTDIGFADSNPSPVTSSFTITKSKKPTPAPIIINNIFNSPRNGAIKIKSISSDSKQSNIQVYSVSTINLVGTDPCILTADGELRARVSTLAPTSVEVKCKVSVFEIDNNWYLGGGTAIAETFTFNIGNSIDSITLQPAEPRVDSLTSTSLGKVTGPDSRTVTYQWSYSDSSDGDFVDIVDANSSTYKPRYEEGYKYLKVTASIGSGVEKYSVSAISKSPVYSTATYVTFSAVSVTWDSVAPQINVINSAPNAIFTYRSNSPIICNINSTSGQITLISPGTCSITVSTTIPNSNLSLVDITRTFKVERSITATPQPTITTQSRSVSRNSKISISAQSSDTHETNTKIFNVNTIMPLGVNACYLDSNNFLFAQIKADASAGMQVICSVSVSEYNSKWHSRESTSEPQNYIFEIGNSISDIALSTNAPVFGVPIVATLGTLTGPDSMSVSYLWSSAPFETGTYLAISAGVNNSYTPTVNDIGQFIKVTASIGQGIDGVSLNAITSNKTVAATLTGSAELASIKTVNAPFETNTLVVSGVSDAGVSITYLLESNNCKLYSCKFNFNRL